VNQQVATFDQFDSHLLREERMFKVSGIENPGRQQHDCRFITIAATGRSQSAQGGQ
jgi:hypothetical protein